MYIRFGTYTSALNEAGVSFQREDVTSEASGLLIGFRETWTINGFLQAASPALLTILIDTLEIAFSRNNQPLQLVANDGQTILRQMAPLGALGGTEVVQGPQYPDDGRSSAEYSTYRTYQVVVRGGYAYPNVPPTALLSFHEMISFAGGGPRFVHRQPLNGLPQKQLVADSTPFLAVQQGQAVGLNAYPVPPDPIWPDAEHIDQRRIKPGSPKKKGGAVGAVYIEWPIEWEYHFEDVAPLDGVPNVVTGID